MQYKVYSDSKLLGIATFTDDPVHGDVFLIKYMQDGAEVKGVCSVDEWEMI